MSTGINPIVPGAGFVNSFYIGADGTAGQAMVTDGVSGLGFASVVSAAYVDAGDAALQAGYIAADSALIAAHVGAADPHTGYALIAGRSGGQSITGGTGAGETLTLRGTSHGTPGKLLFGTSAYDEVNNRLGVGTASPSTPLHVVGVSTFNGNLLPSANDTHDIGVTGTRFRHAWFSGAVTAAGTSLFGSIQSSDFVEAASTGSLRLSGRLQIKSSATGVAAITDAALTAFDSLLLGPSGTTYNRLKHGGAGILQGRLADDSNFCTIQAKLKVHANAVSETITPTHTIILYDAAGQAYRVPCIV